jgi:hypothetical protein
MRMGLIALAAGSFGIACHECAPVREPEPEPHERLGATICAMSRSGPRATEAAPRRTYRQQTRRPAPRADSS